jgi:predicted Mrr-cat superfamily restriction endonuclease
VNIEELINSYDKLDDDIKVEIPLKRIWSLTTIIEE